MAQYESYKPSGISWIGEIPSHWQLVTWRSLLKEHTETNKPIVTHELLALSYALGVTRYADKKYNMDRVKDDYSQYKVVHENDFVISPNDIIKGSAYVSKYYGCISPMYLTFHSISGDLTELDFIGFFIRTKQAGRVFFSLAKGLIGSILENGKYVTRRITVSRNDINSFPIPLPPFDEQKKIVEFLSTKTSQIDAQQRERERELQLLDELKQAEIAEVVTRGLNPDVPMRATEIPWLNEIPAHWEERRAKYLFVKENRPVREFDEVVTCFRDGQVTLRKNRRTEGFTESLKEIGYQGIRRGDLVVHQMDAFAGSSGVSDSDGKSTPVYIVCTPSTENIYNPYFALVLRRMGLNGFIQSLYRGIRERSSNFSYDVFCAQLLPVPPIEEQIAIVAYIQQKTQTIDDMIANLRAEIDFLTEYKQRLIADVVTGQLKVD